MFIRLIAKSLRRCAAAHLIAIAAISVSALVSSVLLNLHYDVKAKMSRDLRRYGANVILFASRTEDGLLDVRQAEELKRLEHEGRIASYAPLLFVAGYARGRAVLIVGSSFPHLKLLNSWWKVNGRWADAGSECMAGRAVAQRLGLKLGDMLDLNSNVGAAALKLTLVGIVETASDEENQIFVSLPVAWSLGGKQGRISALAVSANGDPETVQALALRLSSAIPGTEARLLRQIVEAEELVLERIRLTMLLVTGLVMTIAALCVMTTLLARTVERSKEVALMRALGARSRRIVLIFLSETAVIGLAGGIVGYALGLILASRLERKLFGAELAVRLEPLLLVLLVSAITALVGGITPTRRALKIEPAAVLRGE